MKMTRLAKPARPCSSSSKTTIWLFVAFAAIAGLLGPSAALRTSHEQPQHQQQEGVTFKAKVKGRCLDSCRVYHRIISCQSFHSHDILDCYRSFPDSTVLDLSYCRIPRLGSWTLGKLPTIERLYLDGVNVGAVDCKVFKRMKKLQFVSIRGLGNVRLRKVLPSVLQAPSSLRHMCVLGLCFQV